MTRSTRRIHLTPGYLLHHRPWRDTSRILEVLTREHGRLTLFARGVRGPSAKLASVLQPFQLLLLSWSGRGEAPQLTAAERARHDPALAHIRVSRPQQTTAPHDAAATLRAAQPADAPPGCYRVKALATVAPTASLIGERRSSHAGVTAVGVEE